MVVVMGRLAVVKNSSTRNNILGGGKTRGRSSVGRAPALQVDKPKRCAFMRLRRWRMSAEARIIRSSARAQNRLRVPEGETLPVQPTPDVQQALHLSDTRSSVDVTPDG